MEVIFFFRFCLKVELQKEEEEEKDKIMQD